LLFTAQTVPVAFTHCEGRQIEADRLRLASSYQYEIMIESLVLKIVLGSEKEVLSERQRLLAAINKF